MRNGTASLLCFLWPLFMGDLVFIANVKSSMLCSICCEADAHGACCRTICLPGKRSITIFVCGGRRVCGNGFIPHCVSKRVQRWAVKRNQVQASSTARVSKPLVC